MRSLYKLDELTTRNIVLHRLVCSGSFGPSLDDSLTDVGYTGLTDTASSFTEGASFDGMTPGSALPLGAEMGQGIGPLQSFETSYVIGSPSDPATFSTSTADFVDATSISSNIEAANILAGANDPSFQSTPHTPTALADSASGSQMNAFSAMSKFGSSIASLFGNHPQTVAPNGATRSQLGAPITPVASGTQTIILIVIVVALGLLLVREE